MKFLLTILAPLLLLGAGCFDSTSAPTAVDILEVETSPSIAVATTPYVMSKNQLMFSAPSDWSVTQTDAGNASVIEIKSVSGPTMTIILERTQTFDGDVIAYNEWLTKQFETPATSQTEVGHYTFDVYKILIGGVDDRTILTGEVVGDDTNYFIKLILPVVIDDEVQAIVDSIVFNPGEDDRANAQIIP